MHKTRHKSGVRAARLHECGNKHDELMSAYVVSVILVRIAQSPLLEAPKCGI